MKDAGYWIEKLELQKHPEGGWYKEVYRSKDKVDTPAGSRSEGTCIYYLLEKEDFSAFHRIRSDEIWHFYTGSSAVEILWIDGRELHTSFLGQGDGEHFQIVVLKNHWFAARLVNKKGFALVGCTVAPGFHFPDFELADEILLQEYPELRSKIKSLIRG